MTNPSPTPLVQQYVQHIRQCMFAHRNGLVAEKLRQAGIPHQLILGCLAADLAAIAKAMSTQMANDSATAMNVAQVLWKDKQSREARLIATMLVLPEQITYDMAQQWCDEVMTTEEADWLCLRVLRQCDFAILLVKQLVALESAYLQHYIGYRLLLHLLNYQEQHSLIAGDVHLVEYLNSQQEREPDALKMLVQQILQNLSAS